MNVEFKLSAATSGTTASTAFNISGTTSSNVVSELATGVTKSQLTTGYTINGVNDAITGGTIASISPSLCTGFTATWTVIQQTPTPTPTATAIPSYEYSIAGTSYSQSVQACTNASMEMFNIVYAATNIPGNVIQFFTDSNLTSAFTGDNEFYVYYKSEASLPSSVNHVARVEITGAVTDRELCS